MTRYTTRTEAIHREIIESIEAGDATSAPSPLEVAATRRLVGLTVEELATMLGVNPRTIRGWEGGRFRPSEGVWAAVQDIRAGHDRETERAGQIVDAGLPLTMSLDRDFPIRPVPRGWMVAIAARVLDACPDARIEWAE